MAEPLAWIRWYLKQFCLDEFLLFSMQKHRWAEFRAATGSLAVRVGLLDEFHSARFQDDEFHWMLLSSAIQISRLSLITILPRHPYKVKMDIKRIQKPLLWARLVSVGILMGFAGDQLSEHGDYLVRLLVSSIQLSLYKHGKSSSHFEYRTF